MKTIALIKQSNKTELRECNIQASSDLIIKVDTAGICRTDIYAADNLITTKDNLILGHEFTGYIYQTRNPLFKEGDLVAVNPIFEDLTMIGVEHDGCFSEYISLDSSHVYKFGDFHDKRVPAYVEPIAASLAPLKSKFIKKDIVGAVYGENRIGLLTYQIMKKNGYNIQLIDSKMQIEDNSFDYIIETLANKETFDKLSRIIKKNGFLILKSRFPNHISVNFYDYVRKEIIIEPLYYHDFEFAINYAKTNYTDFLHLFGESFPLSNWQVAFKESITGDKKIFFKF